MISLRHVMSFTILPFIMFSFLQCSSQKKLKLQDTAPVQYKGVYCQNWIAGVKGGGSGTNIFIPLESVSDKAIELDSVYFRGKSVKLETKPQSPTLYIGRFSSPTNTQKNMVMSGDAKQEFGNKMPAVPKKIPFELKDNECVVSYKEGSITKYFKIENVVEKASTPYPGVRPNN